MQLHILMLTAAHPHARARRPQCVGCRGLGIGGIRPREAGLRREGVLVRVLWAGRYGRGAVDRSDALAAEVLVRTLLARVLLCVAQMAQMAQVAQMAQEDAGDAGDAEDSDAPAARRTKRTGKGDR